MPYLRVPTSVDPATPLYLQNTELEGRDFVLDFEYNQRNKTWYLTISDVEGVLLAAGLPVVTRWFLLKALVAESLPPGELLLLTFQGNPAKPPGLTDLGGGRSTLFYVTADEFAGAGRVTDDGTGGTGAGLRAKALRGPCAGCGH